MKKIIFIIIIIILAFIIVSILAIYQIKNMIINTLITKTTKAGTGLDVSIRNIDTHIVKTAVNADGIVILNPHGFEDKMMADISNLYIRLEPFALFKRKIHLRDLKLDLRQFFIIKNPDGRINLDSLKFMKEKPSLIFGKKSTKEKPFSFLIDRLQLSIGKVIYKDYTQQPPRLIEFDIDIKDEVYENVTDLTAISGIVVARALARTNLADILGYNLAEIHNRVIGVIKKGSEILTQAPAIATGIVKETYKQTKEVIEKTGEKIKQLFKTE